MFVFDLQYQRDFKCGLNKAKIVIAISETFIWLAEFLKKKKALLFH